MEGLLRVRRAHDVPNRYLISLEPWQAHSDDASTSRGDWGQLIYMKLDG